MFSSRNWPFSVMLAMAFLLFFPAASLPATAQIQIKNFFFDPDPVTVTEGDTVVWRNVTTMYHTTTSGSNCISNGTWSSELLGRFQTFTQVFVTAGTYPYFCIPHCDLAMVGTITVEKLATAIGSVKLSLFDLKQNHPNPFNPDTYIDYTVGRTARVEIAVYDARGGFIRKIVDGVMTPGGYTAVWDGRDGNGIAQGSGVYFYGMKIDGVSVDTRRMVLLK